MTTHPDTGLPCGKGRNKHIYGAARVRLGEGCVPTHSQSPRRAVRPSTGLASVELNLHVSLPQLEAGAGSSSFLNLPSHWDGGTIDTERMFQDTPHLLWGSGNLSCTLEASFDPEFPPSLSLCLHGHCHCGAGSHLYQKAKCRLASVKTGSVCWKGPQLRNPKGQGSCLGITVRPWASQHVSLGGGTMPLKWAGGPTMR